MELSGRTLLFVEDDKQLSLHIQEYFSAKNTVMIADCLNRAEECLRLLRFDAVVIDILLPDGSGLDLFEKFKKLPPTLIMSGLGDEENILEGFYCGAIDYIVKPCSMRLLEAKIALRLLPAKSAEKTCEGLKINPINRTVFYGEKQISLTSSEFNILYFLMTHTGEFFSSNELYEQIWQAKSLNTMTIRKHISSMRRKLLDATQGREFILTDFGRGYSFVESDV